jgi:CO/xanthine dehydrogenase Mo-binding subunit
MTETLQTDVLPAAAESAPRDDLIGKVTGTAEYVDDLPHPPGMVYGAAIRSPYAHARILSIDTSAALAMDGVVGVLDRDNLDGLDPIVRVGEYAGRTREHGESADQHFLTIDKGRFHGDLVGMVVAEDLGTARRAAEAVKIEWEELPAVFGAEEALAPAAAVLHEDLGTNLAVEDSFEWGDVETGLASADKVFEAAYFTPNAFHHPMEPVGSCIADFRGDEAVFWLPTNKPFNPTHQVAELFGIDPSSVRVRVPTIGGAFGAKQITPAMMAALALSKRLARPVRVVATGEESFRASARHAAMYRAKVGVDANGKLVALDVELDIDTGAYFTGARLVARNMCISAWGCYRLPHFRVRARVAYTNKVPAASFRATGKTQTTFAIESLLDKVSNELGVDPLEFRRQNTLQRGERIAETWRVRGTEYPADVPPMDTDFDDLIARASGGIGWDRPLEPPSTPAKKRGRGLALSLRHGAQGGGRAYALATMDAGGNVRISHAAPDLGGGVFTMIGLVASRTLDIPLEQVTVEMPDTQHGLNFEGTAAQRTTVHMGNAVRSACEDLKRELLQATAEAKGGEPADWSVASGRVVRGDESYSFAEIVCAFGTAPAFEGMVLLKGLGSYSYKPSPDMAFGGLDHWAPGAAAVEVEVDTETGAVEIVKASIVADAGEALHYDSARAQAEGGGVMGMGLGLNEETLYGENRMLNANAFHYRLPTMKDMPEHFVVSIVENHDGPGPFGSKGLAQTSIPCMSPALNNAILDAIGVQLSSSPLTGEKVLEALGVLGTEAPDA